MFGNFDHDHSGFIEETEALDLLKESTGTNSDIAKELYDDMSQAIGSHAFDRDGVL